MNKNDALGLVLFACLGYALDMRFGPWLILLYVLAETYRHDPHF